MPTSGPPQKPPEKPGLQPQRLLTETGARQPIVINTAHDLARDEKNSAPAQRP
jgi:hypothetical protein